MLVAYVLNEIFGFNGIVAEDAGQVRLGLLALHQVLFVQRLCEKNIYIPSNKNHKEVLIY